MNHNGSRIQPAAWVLAGMTLAVVLPFLLLGRTMLPHYLPHTLPTNPFPWQGPRHQTALGLDEWGGYNLEFAHDCFVVNGLKQGSLPLWNPYLGLGQPILANPIAAVSSPVNLLRIPLPPSYWDLVLWFQWFLTGYFFFAYLRVIGLDSNLAIFGAIGVMGCGFFIGNILVRSVAASAMWFPLALYAIESSMRMPHRRRNAPLLAMATFGMATGGQPELSLLGAALIGAYLILRWVFQPVVGQAGPRLAGPRLAGPRLARCFAAVFAGGLIAAPAWLSFVDYVLSGQGLSTHPGIMGVKYFSWKSLPNWFLPFSYGFPGPSGPVLDPPGHLYLGWFPPTLTYFSFLGFTVLARRRRPMSLCLLSLLGILALAKILGVPGLHQLGLLPWLDKLWFARFLGFAVVFAMAAAAAVGLDATARGQSRPPVWPWLGFLGLNLVLAATLIDFQKASPTAIQTTAIACGLGLFWGLFPLVYTLWRPKPGQKLVEVMVAALMTQLVGYYLFGLGSLGFGLLGSSAIVVFLIWLGVRSWVFRSRPNPVGAWLGMSAMLAAVATGVLAISEHGPPRRAHPTAGNWVTGELSSRGSRYRVYGLDRNFSSNFGAAYGISTLNTLDPILPTWNDRFSLTSLDRSATPFNFSGTDQPRVPDHTTPLRAYHENRMTFDLIATRFLVTLNRDPRVIATAYDTQEVREVEPIPASLEEGAVLRAEFACPLDYWNAVDVFFAVPNPIGPGVIRLEVRDAQGTLLRLAEAPGDDLGHYRYHQFRFEALEPALGRTFQLQVCFRAEEPGPVPLGFPYPQPSGLGFRFRIPEFAERTGMFLAAEDAQTGIQIWENSRALPRMFVAGNYQVEPDWERAIERYALLVDQRQTVILDGQPDQPLPTAEAGGELLEFHLAPNLVRAVFHAHTPGILVLTDSYFPGWRAWLDGVETRIYRVNGVFRGIVLAEPGTYQIEWRFRPRLWKLMLGLAAAGLFGLGCLVVWGHPRLGQRTKRPALS